MPDKELFRPGEVARIIHVHIDTIYRWIREGRLEIIRLPSNHIRVKRASIEKIVS